MPINFLINRFNNNLNSDAIIWKNKCYNYNWLIDNINKCQKIVDSNHISKGTVVAIDGDFSPVSIALLLALIDNKCIIVPLTNSANKNESNLFNIAQVEFVFRVNGNDVITTDA